MRVAIVLYMFFFSKKKLFRFSLTLKILWNNKQKTLLFTSFPPNLNTSTKKIELITHERNV